MVLLIRRNLFVDIDDCSDTPCAHGGECIDGVDEYSCNCVPGYTGNDCDVGKIYQFPV